MRTISFIALACDLIGLAVALATGSLPAYLLFCAFATIGCFGIDKLSAIRQGERMPERFLLFQALIGGALPMLFVMFIFHHKSCKPTFYGPVVIFAIVHIIVFGRFVL